MASQMMAAAMAHINEHIAFEYRKRLEQELGVPMPAPNTILPEDFEIQLSRLTARAAEQLLQKNQTTMQQQQNAALQQDPVVQMQQKELDIKAEREKRELMKDQAEIELKQRAQAEKVELERTRIASLEKMNNENNQTKLIQQAAKMGQENATVRISGAENKGGD
jgi:hypothetical protein